MINPLLKAWFSILHDPWPLQFLLQIILFLIQVLTLCLTNNTIQFCT
jgi:hypothetical protein